MIPALSGDQIRRIDKAAVMQLGLPSLLLMENAARGVCERIQDLGSWRSITILAGPGNNGGDGLAIARLLNARGLSAKTFLIRNGKSLSEDAARNFDFLEKSGMPASEVSVEILSEHIASLNCDDLIVDAMLGTGTRGELRSPYRETVSLVNDSLAKVLSVDIPTGFDCDTGQAIEPCIQADWTVTFAAMKIGFLNSDASEYTGTVTVSDIGVPQSWLEAWLTRS